MVEGNFNEFSIQFTLNFTADPNDPWTYFMSANAFVSSNLHKVSLSCNVNRFEQTGTIKVSLFWSGMTGWTIIKWLHEMIIWCNLFYNWTFLYDLRKKQNHRATNIITHMLSFILMITSVLSLSLFDEIAYFLIHIPKWYLHPATIFLTVRFSIPQKLQIHCFHPSRYTEWIKTA